MTETIGVPVIASISILTNKHVLLNCLRPVGATIRIQGATDLHTWSDLGTNTAASNVAFQFEDATATGFARRFYRLVTP